MIKVSGCLLPILIIVLSMQACYNDKADKLYGVKTTSTCDTSNVSYATIIAPIMQQNCTTSGCHDAVTQSGGYNFTVHSGLVTAIVNNRLIGCIRHEAGYNAMPNNGGKLADCDISKIVAWVNAGFPNN